MVVSLQKARFIEQRIANVVFLLVQQCRATICSLNLAI